MKTIKNLALVIIALMVVGVMTFLSTSCIVEAPSSSETVQESQEQMTEKMVENIKVPEVSYFQERRTIAKWVERWDAPSIPTYVYLISYGNILGYYVADGKPAATTSYLTPEEKFEEGVDVGDSYGDVLVSAPDIDGTWGFNNPGIRFFTAEGTAVEWGGVGATYIYSDAPLPLNVPKLNISK